MPLGHGPLGAGWTFAPDFFPTGETLFMTGPVANSGGYTGPTDDAMINQTLTSGSLQDLPAWPDCLAPRLPMM